MVGELNASVPSINFTEAFQGATADVSIMDAKDAQISAQQVQPENLPNAPRTIIDTGPQDISERVHTAMENTQMISAQGGSLLTEAIDATNTLQMNLSQGHQLPPPANTNPTQSVDQNAQMLEQQQAMENTKYTREAQLNIDTPNGPSMGGMAA